MHTFEFSISITPESWSEFYRRPNSRIVATDVRGQRIQLAAKHFQKFVSRDGIKGYFRLTLNKNNDLVSLDRLK